jgi:hypothetical protein
MAKMVVEFFGMPGAGKSHLCRLVSSRLRDRGWRVKHDIVAEDHVRTRRLSRKLLPVLGEWLRSRESRGIVRSTLRVPGLGFVTGLRLSFNWLYVRARARVADSMGDDFCISDQGCAQALWSEAWAMQGSTDARSWSEATAGLTTPFVVVDVHVPVEVAGARTRGRHSLNSPIDGRRQDEERLGRAFLVTEQVRRRLVRGGDDLLILPASGEGGEMVALEIVSKLEAAMSALARSPMEVPRR